MAQDNKIRLPCGQGGLMRYFDEYSSQFTFSPGTAVILAVVVMLLVLLLHYFGGRFLS